LDRNTLRRLTAIGAVLVLAATLGPTSSAQQAPTCSGWQIEYALSASLELSDTPLGQGDGVYAIGPGRAVLRLEDADGRPGGTAAMLSYEMRENFTVTSKLAVFATTIVTDAWSRASPDSSGIAACGRLGGTTLEWNTPVEGYRTDGTLNCEGMLCGKLGAPPPGRSELHIGPHPVRFEAFEFARDLKTFTMASTFVANTEVPRQTAYIALAGRETRRSCALTTACR
jgi:hypothetical protein